MAWLKIDDQFPDHPKVVAAGKDAGWLHICAICYCGRYLTDGFVPEAMVPRLAEGDNAALVARLVDVGLWELDDGGYRVHDYLEYNPTAADVKAKRAANAKRQADWREGHRSDSGRYNAVTNASHNTAPSPSPSPSPSPIPSPVEEAAPDNGSDPEIIADRAELFGMIAKANMIVNSYQSEHYSALLDDFEMPIIRLAFAEAKKQGNEPRYQYLRAMLRRCKEYNCKPGEWPEEPNKPEPKGEPYARDGPLERFWGVDNNGNRVELTR